MKKIASILLIFLSLILFANAKCGEFSAKNILLQDADTLRIDATRYCDNRGVSVEANNGHNYVGFLDPNDWIAWDVDLPAAGTYQVTYSVASLEGKGAFQFEQFGGTLIFGSVTNVPKTGSWYTFATAKHTVQLPKGKQTVAIAIREGGFNIDWFEFRKVESDSVENPTRFMCTKDEYALINLNGRNRIPAANFCDAQGVQVETSKEGGFNVGWIDSDDFMVYNVHVPKEDLYKINYRVASENGSGGFVVEMYDETAFGTKSNELRVPRTGGWQTWKTISHTMFLTKGKNTMVLRATKPGWNLLWIEITRVVPTPVNPPVAAPIIQEPPQAPVRIVNPVPSPIKPPVTAPSVPTPGKGFVRAIGKRIVDGKGNNLILRGQGLGGWMLQEPYQMLTVDAAPKGQWQMFEKIKQTVGAAGLEQYHQAWLDNWCTYEDVKELKASGFNSIRVALHYNLFTLPIEKEPVRGQDTWLQKGFDRLDLLLQWCEMEEIYLILDLHAAPGGQGHNSAINDYDDSKPSMWQDKENIRKSIALWVKWAQQYKDNAWVAGYDLLNEPNWGFEPGHLNGCSDQNNAPLKDFYDRAIEAIRKVDKNHIIYINGNCWGNNHKGLWPFADDNVVLSFHRYWIPNTDQSIQEYLDMRDKYNVPIWMGESGEHDNLWYKEAVQLLERHNVGWAWWTWKKMQSSSGSYSITPPDQYQTLINYWASRGPKPANAMDILMQLAKNALLRNCIRNDGAIVALVGRP